MTTPVNPFLPVPAPPLVPIRYGLQAAATVIDMPAGQWEYGVVWDDSDNCTSGGVWQPCCSRFDTNVTGVLRQVSVSVTFTAFPALGGGVEFRAIATDSWSGGPIAGIVGAGPTDTAPISTNDTTVVIGQEAACGQNYQITAEFPGFAGGAQQTGTIAVSADEGDTPCSGTATLNFVLDVPEPTTEKAFSDSTFTFGDPFIIYDGRICPTLTEEQLRDSARNRLALSEWRQIEQMFARGVTHPSLAEAGVVVLNGGVAVSPSTGIALLEGCLQDRYLGTGLIHAPRWTAGLFNREYQISYDLGTGPVLRTSIGTGFVFGSGYDGSAPAGQPAPATSPVPGQAWIYATGQVVVRRSPVVVNATRDRTGCVTGLAERTVVLGVQCEVRCAVLVDFARCDCCEPTP